jgi:hypothetical protein
MNTTVAVPETKSLLSSNEVVRLENVSVSYRVPSEYIGTFKEYIIRRMQGKLNTILSWR